MIRAVLSDLDDTLIDTTSAIRTAARSATADMAPSLDDEACATWWVDPGGYFAAYDRGELSFAEQREARLVRLCSEHGLPDLDEAGRRRWLDHYERALVAASRAFDDVPTCLRALEAQPLGIVTNIAAAPQLAKLRTAGLDGVFEVVLGVDSFGVRKPSPEGFLAGCAALGVQVTEAAYIGDLLDTDARGAAAAGLCGIWLDRTGSAPTPPDVERIRSLAELPALLGVG